MKAFLTRFGLFVLPVFLGIVLLYWKPINKQFGYSYLLESCERSDFLYHQLFEGKPIDIAFLGTSVTLCGVQDDTLEQRLSRKTGEHLRTVNLGFCRPGRNLHYVFLKDLLANHHPKLILIETRFREDRFSHKDFPFVAEGGDLWNQNILFNQRYPETLLEGLESRWNETRHNVLQIPFQAIDSAQIRPHSYVAVDVKADPNDLGRRQERAAKRYDELQAAGKGLGDKISYRYPRKTLEAMAELAEEANIPIVFYYLKSFGHPATEPWDIDIYRQYGEVWIPPDSIFQKKENFFDQDHLNDQGASLLADWFEGEIAGFLERM
jgi:hypothetical protein